MAVCLRRLAERGIRIPAGQNVSYVIADRKHAKPLQRCVPVPLLDKVRDYDAAAYEALLLDAFHEVTVHLEGTRGLSDMGRQISLWARSPAVGRR